MRTVLYKPELLRHALENSPPGQRINLLAACGIVFVLRNGPQGGAWLWTWFLASLSLAILRFLLHRNLSRAVQTDKLQSPAWVDRAWLLHCTSLVLAGSIWAALMLFGLKDYTLEQQYLTIMVLSAMAGGATGVVAPMQIAGSLYITLMMVPACMQLASQEPPQVVLCGLGSLFYIVMLASHRNNHRLLRRSIGLQHENRKLVEQLTNRAAEVQSANAELEQRVGERTSELHTLAHHDSLTELLNRRGLMLELGSMPPRERQQRAFLFIDLDHFKQINDGLGHDQGDLVLRGVARRLRELLPSGHLLARWGGDEFIVVTPALAGARQQVVQLTDTIQLGLSQSFAIESGSVHVGASIGVAIEAEGGAAVDQSLREADLAAGEAKRLGRGRVAFFEERLSSIQRRKLAINVALRYAVEDQSLWLAFQPLVSVASGQVLSVEALLRWNPRRLGSVEPQEFIAHAEESDRILELGEWVLQHACQAAANWAANGAGGAQAPSVAVNVSMRQLVAPGFVAQGARTLAQSRLTPQRLVIEITESALVDNISSQILETLLGLRALGVQIHIDDFGTGYSSLSRLREFPIDGIKIDRSFVAELDDRALAVVESAVLIAKRFSLKVVAEGIETMEQAIRLQSLGIDEFQGYMIGMPLAHAELGTVEPVWLAPAVRMVGA